MIAEINKLLLFAARNVYQPLSATPEQRYYEDIQWSTADESEEVHQFEKFAEVCPSQKKQGTGDIGLE